MDEKYVHQRLENPSDQNRRCQRVYQSARHVSNVEHKDNRAENRKIFDAVRVSPRRAPIPFLAPSGVSREIPDWYPSAEDATPTIYSNREKQQEQGPHCESEQHPHRHCHC
jgi:hypothetical protein